VAKYLDFDLLIDRVGDSYRAQVLNSPGGEATEDFELPFSDEAVENLVLKVTKSLGDARREVRSLGSSERQAIEAFGAKLFDAVFSGTVREAFARSVSEADRRRASGLRLRLRFGKSPELQNLPWEYLFNTDTGQFPALLPESPLVRYTELGRTSKPLPITPPLRVLVMISRPTDVRQLKTSQEWDLLNEALKEVKDQGLVHLQLLDGGTLAALQRPLRLGVYHVFHFVGHGGFEESVDEGALLLENDEGHGRLVTGSDLGMMLSGHRSLRLVVLNACEGARSSATDPFGGVSQALIRQGIPAVVAMQFEITDPAAITFAPEFYRAIAEGFPVDRAVTEARRAIFASGNEVEWATPVLYLRSPNGQIFNKTPTPPLVEPGPRVERLPQPATEPATEPPPEAPLRPAPVPPAPAAQDEEPIVTAVPPNRGPARDLDRPTEVDRRAGSGRRRRGGWVAAAIAAIVLVAGGVVLGTRGHAPQSTPGGHPSVGVSSSASGPSSPAEVARAVVTKFVNAQRAHNCDDIWKYGQPLAGGHSQAEWCAEFDSYSQIRLTIHRVSVDGENANVYVTKIRCNQPADGTPTTRTESGYWKVNTSLKEVVGAYFPNQTFSDGCSG
jgi:hypothetical protein